MNNGDDTAYYLRRGFRVVAIEADTCLAKCAAERFRTQISSGRLRILNIGIAAEEGELPFWICETHSEWSSFDRKIASRMVAHISRSWCPVVGLIRFLRNLEYLTT